MPCPSRVLCGARGIEPFCSIHESDHPEELALFSARLGWRLEGHDLVRSALAWSRSRALSAASHISCSKQTTPHVNAAGASHSRFSVRLNRRSQPPPPYRAASRGTPL